MATITTRSGKGSPLTNNEVDANFTNLNTDKAELSGATFTGNLNLGDNVKAQFGSPSNDLQIYHDGSNSYINDTGTGALFLKTNYLAIAGANGNQLINAEQGGALELYHANAKKLETKATGIDVTGTATMDGLTVKNPNVSGEQTILKIENAVNTGTIGKITFNQTDDRMGISNEASGSLSFDTATLERLNIASNGDISFYNDSAAQAFFFDSSTSRLGLGTTNPSVLLDLGSSSGQKVLMWSSGNIKYGMAVETSEYQIFAEDQAVLNLGHMARNNGSTFTPRLTINADGSSVFSGAVTADKFKLSSTNFIDSPTTSIIRYSVGSGDHVFFSGSTSNSELLRIKGSNGNCTIPNGSLVVGTTFTSSKFEINHGRQTGALGLGTATSLKLSQSTGAPAVGNVVQMTMGYGNTYSNIAIAAIRTSAAAYGTDDLVFATKAGTTDTAPTERARITSDGHFIVGNTSAFSSSSFCVDQSGLGQFRRDGTPLIVRRDGSVGDLISFEDDGTTVGSIGTPFAGELYIAASGTNSSGLLLTESNAVRPMKNGSASDATQDLGRSNGRWKDLYLSGGVYLGGTGAANKLSDFEFGTWTPVVTSSGGTITSVTGKVGTYTKIGRTVIVQYQFNIADLGTGSGHIIVSGRPFTEDNSVISYYAGVHRARAGASSITEFDPDGTFRLYGTTPVTNVYLGSMVYNTTS